MTVEKGSSITKQKIIIIYAIPIIFVIVAIIRLLYIYITNDYIIHNVSLYNVQNKRYVVYDRHKNILATDLNSYDLYIRANSLQIQPNILAIIAKIFPDVDIAKIENSLLHKNHGRVLVKRFLNEDQKQMVYKNGISTASFDISRQRFYPYGNLFSHVVGYSSIEGDGFAGLERSFNRHLWEEDLYTSLDMQIQFILHDRLKSVLDYYGAKNAFGVVLNINNGEVLGMVSLPDFNPNKNVNPLTDSIFNYVTASRLELGSVFKIFTTAFAIQSGMLPDTKIDLSKKIFLTRDKAVVDEHGGHESMTLEEVFYRSSNIGSARIVDEFGGENFKHFLEKIGVLSRSKLKIELPSGEVSASSFGKWSQSLQYTASYGYGIAMSPLYFLTTAAAMINDGQYVSPTLLRRKRDVEIQKNIYSKKYSKLLRDIASKITKDGTAKRANVDRIDICGKTGTAEKFSVAKHMWEHDKKLTSFFGVFPCQDPQYAIFIGVDEPHYTQRAKEDGKSGILQGGTVAAPVAGEVISTILSLYQDK